MPTTAAITSPLDLDNPRPITDAWLCANGWRLVSQRNDERTRPEAKLRRLAIRQAAIDWPQPFASPDDLCIDLAPGHDGKWFCWLHQAEPYRFLHVRHMRYRWEVMLLWQGLTGRDREWVNV